MKDQMPKYWSILNRLMIPVMGGSEYVLEVGQYDNGRLAVQVYNDSSPYCRLTVNLPDEHCEENQFFVKLGGAEERIAKTLEGMKLIKSTNITASSEFVIEFARLYEINTEYFSFLRDPEAKEMVEKKDEEQDSGEFKPTTEQILIVAERHIERFESRIAAALAGARGIRIDECRMYLALWQSIKDKNGIGLTTPEKNELKDAIYGNEFDEFMTEEQLKAQYGEE